jgi:hypothetical protein|tara:strand:- start:500 stop:733 length:234 start_codon:yes stop_codon:yes gene_type:complete
MANPKSAGQLPESMVPGFYTIDGKDVAVVIIPVDHTTSKVATDKGNVTVGHYREDLAASDGKVYTFSGMCYRHDRKK